MKNEVKLKLDKLLYEQSEKIDIKIDIKLYRNIPNYKLKAII